MGKFKKFPVLLTVFLLLGTLVFAGGPNAKMKIKDPSDRVSPRLPYAAGEALVKFKKGMTVNALNQLAAQNGMIVKKRFAVLSKLKGQEYALLKSSVADTVGMMNVLRNNAAVEAVSPNNLNQVDAIPNDPFYAPYMWGLNNTTQTGGTADADIDAPEAWDINTGSANNIVAVIDTGFDYTHPDLAANAWANAAELAGVAGVDDDGNGYVDDIYGIDPAGTDGFTPDNDPMDGYGHGTHCAGTIGGVGNNSVGIVGVNWNVKIMGLKFMDEAGGNGWDSYAIECIEYILFQKIYRGRNIVAVNASWGNYNYFDQALYDAIAALGDAGIVFCAAAGNDANNNDGADVHYPSSYDLPNLIAVAATDDDDLIADFSNFGATTVDLGAPGVGILSTIPKWYKPQAGDLFFDDMESGVGNWTHGGTNDSWAITTTLDPIFVNPAFPVPSPPHFWADSPGVNYLDDSNNWLAYNADIDLSSYVGTNLYFGIGSAMYFESYWDHGIVEFSNDSGVTWTAIYDFSFDAYYWSQWSWLIPEVFKTSHFRMRFHLIGDDWPDSSYPGWNIDNIGIGVANQYYDSWSGTSMACPHVAGAVALMAAQFPSESMTNRIDRILSTVDHNTSLEGLCVTEGRLNLYNAITYDPGTTTISVTAPNGDEEWTTGSIHNITWNSTGAIANVDIDYSINNGSNWLPVVSNTLNDGSFAWTVPVASLANCLVRIGDAVDDNPSDSSDNPFAILAAGTESVTAPQTPLGPSAGTAGSSYDFSTKGSESSMGVGHMLQYKFDWNDGTDSGWINAGMVNTQASHSWAAPGTYNVRAMARCAQHTAIESPWSETHAIIITIPGTLYYNSPASRLLFPEVNWVGASNGGMWVTEMQILDVSGGSTVRAYYSYGANRYGPITIWTNSSSVANSSVTFANILQTMDSLDASAAVYFGTGGSLELVTQDGSHVIQVASRSYNGNSSCTFPALQDIETNTAAEERSLVIPNISNNTAYRAKIMLVNSSDSSAGVEVKIIGSNGSQVGGTISRTLAGYEMLPLVNEMRVNTYNNATIRIDVVSGGGRVMASGQTTNNVTNDPAAHIAVQTATGFANSPANRLLFPEVNWVGASNGGMWVTEMQIVDVSGGSTVQAYYSYGANRYGPITIWTNSGGAANSSITFSNILQTMDSLDASAAVYSGTGGSLELVTQDGSHVIQVASRSYNGDSSCSFPALRDINDNTAAVGRSLVVPNISNNTDYRAKIMLVNTTSSSATVEVRIIGSNGSQVGSTISRTMAGYEMLPLVNELRVNTYDNAAIRIDVTSGSGRVMVSGQTSNNVTNDPAAHIAVQAQ